jgi:hypothetical protein
MTQPRPPDDVPAEAAALRPAPRPATPVPDPEAVPKLSAQYGRFYPPLGVGLLTLAWLPPLDQPYGTLLTMAAQPNGGPAVLGVLLLAGLLTCLATAAVRGHTAALPATIAVMAAALVTLLITKPNTATPTPGLSDTGTAGLALLLTTTILSATHAVHVAVASRHQWPRR